MRGRPAVYDNEQILQKAQQVFWTKGFTATSLEDLLKAMEIGSGSFYNAFKGGKKNYSARQYNKGEPHLINLKPN